MSQTRRCVRPAPIAVAVAALSAVGCGGGLPELRPAWFERPTATATHGRITSAHYRTANGPRTIGYEILAVDGAPVRVPGGYVERALWPTDDALGAVAARVRGDPATVAGTWILQIDGDAVRFERLCPTRQTEGRWEGARFTGCAPDVWDARTRDVVHEQP